MKDFIDNAIERIAGREISKGILQFFRYLICGGTATVTDVTILFVLTHFFAVNYLVAAAFAFITGMTVNYTLNTILVFKSSGKIHREYPLFALVGIGGLIWTEVILWFLVDRLGIYVMFAKAVAVAVVLNWNFFMRKKYVFSEEPSAEGREDERTEKKMKILTIAATPFFSDRGCHIRVYNKAKYLGKLGAKVKICSYFGGKDIENLDVERLSQVSWYRRTAPGFSWGKFWLDIKLIFLCRKIIRKFQPDVIHAHLYEGLGVGYLAKIPAYRRIPIVIDLQGFLDEEFRNYNRQNIIARKIFVWLSKRLINRSDWLVLSGENLQPYMEKLVRDKKAISIIRDGIDLDLFRNAPPLPDDEFEKIRNWKRESKTLVYIGGLSDNKGVGELLKAFKEALTQNGDWKLLIGGYGNDEEKYKKFVEENDLGDSVRFLGRVGYFSLPAYLALADAAVEPKRDSTESSGKLMNLMAAGLPIICFDNDFNRVRLGEKGLYMKDFSDLGAALQNLDQPKQTDYGLNNHSEEKETRKLFGIFQSLTK